MSWMVHSNAQPVCLLSRHEPVDVVLSQEVVLAVVCHARRYLPALGRDRDCGLPARPKAALIRGARHDGVDAAMAIARCRDGVSAPVRTDIALAEGFGRDAKRPARHDPGRGFDPRKLDRAGLPALGVLEVQLVGVDTHGDAGGGRAHVRGRDAQAHVHERLARSARILELVFGQGQRDRRRLVVEGEHDTPTRHVAALVRGRKRHGRPATRRHNVCRRIDGRQGDFTLALVLRLRVCCEIGRHIRPVVEASGGVVRGCDNLGRESILQTFVDL